MPSHKKGQATLFITLGIVLITLVILVFLLAQRPDLTSQDLAKIESFEQASEAVETCMADFLDQSVRDIAYFGGELESETLTEFETIQTLPEIEQIETNLQIYIERNIHTCDNKLRGTEFIVIMLEKPEITISLQEEIEIEANNLGIIQKKDDETQTTSLTNQQTTIGTNFLTLHQTTTDILNSELGTQIQTLEGYEIETFANQDFTKQLIEITHTETQFTLRTTKTLQFS
jgi:hypothetical protein